MSFSPFGTDSKSKEKERSEKKPPQTLSPFPYASLLPMGRPRSNKPQKGSMLPSPSQNPYPLASRCAHGYGHVRAEPKTSNASPSHSFPSASLPRTFRPHKKIREGVCSQEVLLIINLYMPHFFFPLTLNVSVGHGSPRQRQKGI